MSEAGVPALRFAEFKGTWEDKPFSDFIMSMNAGVSVNSGDRPAQEGEYGILKTSCVTNGFFDELENKVVSDHDEISRLREPVKSDTIIISRMNTPALVGANALVQSNRDDLFLPDRLWAAKVSSHTVPYWLGLVMADKRTRQKLSDLASGTSGSMKNISKGDVKAMRLHAPTLPEQQKIADFLGAVDARVGLLRRRRDALRAYKKGMMQRLFSQELRFTKPDGSPFPDWQEKRLGVVFDWIATNSLSREMLTNEPSDLQNIHYGDIHTKFSARFKQSEEKVPYIKPGVSLRLDDASFCCAGDVVIADASEDYADIGKAIEIVEVAPKSLVAGLHTYIARPKVNTLSIGFSGYLFQTSGLRKQVMRIAQGISVLGISKPNLSKLTINLPHPQEQQKIAETLTALDAKIDAVIAQIDAMLRFKKGLLQQMFV